GYDRSRGPAEAGAKRWNGEAERGCSNDAERVDFAASEAARSGGSRQAEGEQQVVPDDVEDTAKSEIREPGKVEAPAVREAHSTHGIRRAGRKLQPSGSDGGVHWERKLRGAFDRERVRGEWIAKGPAREPRVHSGGALPRERGRAGSER